MLRHGGLPSLGISGANPESQQNPIQASLIDSTCGETAVCLIPSIDCRPVGAREERRILMSRIVGGILVVVLGLSTGAATTGQDKPATPAEQYQKLAKEFSDAGNAYYLKATTDAERNEALARLEMLPGRFLELAEKNPRDPVALDALVEAVAAEIWLEGNSTHPGFGKDSP